MLIQAPPLGPGRIRSRDVITIRALALCNTPTRRATDWHSRVYSTARPVFGSHGCKPIAIRRPQRLTRRAAGRGGGGACGLPWASSRAPFTVQLDVSFQVSWLPFGLLDNGFRRRRTGEAWQERRGLSKTQQNIRNTYVYIYIYTHVCTSTMLTGRE